MVKLKDYEASRIADFLQRVVPKGDDEGEELVALLKRLRGVS